MDRLTRLKETIKTHGLDGMIITGRPTHLYFSNFSGTTSYLLVTLNKSFLLWISDIPSKLVSRSFRDRGGRADRKLHHYLEHTH
jgi:Xaa-Pro aminopeptidase